MAPRVKIDHPSAKETQGDLIETYKIMKGKEDVDRNQFLPVGANTAQHNNRDHLLKLCGHRACTDIRKYSFSNRVATE
jgi:hypothetical protein